MLFLLLSFPVIIFSQDKLAQRKTDFMASISADKLYVNGLNLGVKGHIYSKEELLKYYNPLLEDYQSKKSSFNNLHHALWLYEIGYLQINLNKMAFAVASFETALKLVDKKANLRAYKHLKMKLGDVFRITGNKKKSNEIFLDILNLPSIQLDTVIHIYSLGVMAENYEILKEYPKALELSLQLYSFALNKKDYNIASYNLIQMGRIAAFIESDTTYFEYFHLANSMALKSGIKSRIGNNLVNTGIAYRKEGYPLLSLKYLLDAESYAASYTSYGYVYNLLGLSASYSSLDSIPQAHSYAKKAFKLSKEIGAYPYLFDSSLKLANCFIKVNQNDSARIYLKEALRLNRVMEKTNQSIHLYKQLSDISIKLKDYEVAVAYLDSSYIKYTEFTKDTSNDKLAQLRVESDYYINKTKITELISKNKLEKEKTSRLLIITIAIMIALTIATLSAAIIRERLKQLRESHLNLVKKNLELDKLNHKLHKCEVRPLKKIKHEHIKDEDLIIRKLKILLLKNEVFTNSDLSLINLANTLKTNTSYLSAIVNSHFHCNLRNLINRYRIDKARKMLISDEFKHYSMEGISIEVGFKSRSGFYQTFKSVTGLTPTLYIKNYRVALRDSEKMKDPEKRSTL